jgi:hypothetical protein
MDMRFMAIYKPGFEADAPPTEKEMADMGALIAEMTQKGVEVPSKQEAIEWTKRFLSVVGRGESELRLMQDAPAAAR